MLVSSLSSYKNQVNGNILKCHLLSHIQEAGQGKMPTFAIYTNLPKDQIPDNFVLEASKFIADRLGKPESYVTVRVHPDQIMSHGGSTDLCGSVEVYSIGALGDRNKEHAKEIPKFIEKSLGIPKDRFYVTFIDLDRNDVALNGKTFG